MKSGSRAQQKTMTAAEFAAHCGSLTVQTTATATQTAQNATIPASEGKDAAPEASDLVARLENVANCAGIVAEFAPAHGLPSATVAELATFAPELRRIAAEVRARIDELEAALRDAADSMDGWEMRVGFRADGVQRLCDAINATGSEAKEAAEKIRVTLAKLNN